MRLKAADAGERQSLAHRLRKERMRFFLKLIKPLSLPVRILDLGGTEKFWILMELAGNPHYQITVVNLLPQKSTHPNIQILTGDVCDLRAFKPGDYDVIFSNSVIEHVGDFLAQQRMASEIQRLAAFFFVQTPNRYFPIEPHFLFPFFQFLPISLRAFLIRHFNLGWRKKIKDSAEAEKEARSVRLLSAKELGGLFPSAVIQKEKWMGFTKSFMVYNTLSTVSNVYPEASKVPPTMDLMGIPMNAAGRSEVFDFMKQTISRGQKAIALNLNIFCVNLAFEYPWLLKFIQQAHLIYCDGDGVRWGLKLLGYKPQEKITYNKWIWELADFCEKENYKLYLLGGGHGIAQEAADNLLLRYPRLKIIGTHHGYFVKEGEENECVVRDINSQKPDILLVCFGMPIQEKWIRDNWTRISAHVFLKGGAALDYAAGQLKQAPEWMIRMNMEWLYRWFQDPIRLFTRYIIGNPRFIIRILKYKFSRRKGERRRYE